MGLIFHVTRVVFDLREQMSTELLPTVADTLLLPEGEKKREGHVRKCPGMSLTASEFWSVLHHEMSALLNARARPCLC